MAKSPLERSVNGPLSASRGGIGLCGQPGSGSDYTLVFGTTIGLTYFIRKHWTIALKLSYACVLNADTLEHRFGNSLGAGYFF